MIFKLVLVVLLKIAATKSLSCVDGVDEAFGKMCFFDNATVIKNNDSRIDFSDRRDVLLIEFQTFNEEIEYLPVFIHKAFPNVAGISADHLALVEVTRENFVNLKKLIEITAAFNRIEKIASDTFTGLTRLFALNFSKTSNLNY